MDLARLKRLEADVWEIPTFGRMRVPGRIFATEDLVRQMDERVYAQVTNVATLPGIVAASFAMPDAHWGYGFPIGGVAAFDPDDGVVSAGGVGFDISCGVRCLTTGLTADEVAAQRHPLAESLFRQIPAGVGSEGKLVLTVREMDALLQGGARWAVERGFGTERDLGRIEEGGRVAGARPDAVSAHAKERQLAQVGTLGSGNHYLEVQRVAEVLEPRIAKGFGLGLGDALVSIHCGSRGLGHQIGTDYLKEMLLDCKRLGLELPERELACAPIRSELGQRYLGAMRAGIHCALGNRQVLTHLTRRVFGHHFPAARLELLYDVSHNTCKEEEHTVRGKKQRLFVHRKGATRAFGPGHPELSPPFDELGQPVLIGGSMGTSSWVLAGVGGGADRGFASACHGAGRSMSRSDALRRWNGRKVVDALERRGITIKSPSMRGIAEEAPGAYKDVSDVVEAAERAGLAKRVARLEPIVCVKG